MTKDAFNIKYEEFLEEGFETQGLEFDVKPVTEYLDKQFQTLIHIKGFKYSQIKLKFGYARVYMENVDIETLNAIETDINTIIQNWKNQD
jgi:hypothetical protein